MTAAAQILQEGVERVVVAGAGPRLVVRARFKAQQLLVYAATPLAQDGHHAGRHQRVGQAGYEQSWTSHARRFVVTRKLQRMNNIF